MYCRKLKIALGIAAIALLPTLVIAQQQRGGDNALIEAARSGVHLAISVNSKPITDLLLEFNNIFAKKGPNQAVIIFAEPTVTFADIWNIDATAGKAGLTNVHYFVTNKQTGLMTEITWSPSVPMSKTPALRKK